MSCVDDRDQEQFVVDTIDHPVCAPSARVSILQRRAETSADPIRVPESDSDDELMLGESDGLWKVLRQLMADRRRDQ